MVSFAIYGFCFFLKLQCRQKGNILRSKLLFIIRKKEKVIEELWTKFLKNSLPLA